MRADPAARGGLLLLDKPSGPTSHDLVSEARRLTGTRRVGHAGTLDPMATGLLVLLLGRATKLAPFLPGDPKVYEGSILLGTATDTMDIQGEVMAEAAYDGGPERAREALLSLGGEGRQLPPMFSAVKHRGKPLYRYARGGEEVPRLPRRVRVYEVRMTAYREAGEKGELDFLISCSPGAYVREFAARVGEMLGCGGTLARLRRISSGPFRVDDALTREELASLAREGSLPIMAMEDAVADMKKAVLREEWVASARNGAALSQGQVADLAGDAGEGDTVAVITPGGELVGFHAVVVREPLMTRVLRIM